LEESLSRIIIQSNNHKMKKQKPEPPLVMIEWVDSVRPIAHWQLIKDFEEPEPVKCFSVG